MKYPNFKLWIDATSNTSQKNLAAQIDKSDGLISLISRGLQMPTLDTLLKICNVYADTKDEADTLFIEAIKALKTDIQSRETT
tara:strand:+ start:688 stop:936 length:249 start_codon:yes stop_codon:yes gene_type:complete